MLYELYMGHPPFVNSSFQELVKQVISSVSSTSVSDSLKTLPSTTTRS